MFLQVITRRLDSSTRRLDKLTRWLSKVALLTETTTRQDTHWQSYAPTRLLTRPQYQEAKMFLPIFLELFFYVTWPSLFPIFAFPWVNSFNSATKCASPSWALSLWLTDDSLINQTQTGVQSEGSNFEDFLTDFGLYFSENRQRISYYVIVIFKHLWRIEWKQS